MNWDKAIDMLESGEAEMAVLTAVVMRTGGKVWMSFDGEEWEETESEMVKKHLNT